MEDFHRLVMVHGKLAAREMVPASQRRLVDVAAEVMASEEQVLGITYSGFCLTAFPHKRLSDDEPWQRIGHNLQLLVEPGRLLDSSGAARMVGVPYGARARIIMIYLQTQAIRTKSREVELGRSTRDWMSRMGLPPGGETAHALKDQARRISACHIRFFWTGDQAGRRGEGFKNGSIVDGGMFFRDEDKQGALFSDTVTLDEAFYTALRAHPVPLQEAAIRALKEKSLSLDLYVWLAYRLHILTSPMRLSWASVTAQFGAGYRLPRTFRPRFLDALSFALAAYPGARVDADESGILLHPGRPPVAALTRA